MRKSLRISIILLIVMLCFVAVGAAGIDNTATQVTVEEINSFGDKSAAGGIQLSIPVGVLDGRLSWNTEVVIGQESLAKTEHHFYTSAQQDKWRLSEAEEALIRIDVYGSDNNDLYSFEKNKEGEKFFEGWTELSGIYESTDAWSYTHVGPYNRSYNQYVTVNEVYDFYPLYVEGTVSQKNIYREVALTSGVLGIATNAREYTNTYCFSDYGYWLNTTTSEDPVKNLCGGIRYRLWPEYPLAVNMWIFRDLETEEITAYSCSEVLGKDWVECFGSSAGTQMKAYSVSEATETDIYYALDLRLNRGGRPRAETFESGYGVWRIGYRVFEKRGEVKLELTETKPELICEIDPEEWLLDLVYSENQKEMYLFTARDGIAFLSVIDLQTKEVTQKLELFAFNPEVTPKIDDVIQGDDVIVVRMTEEIPVGLVRESKKEVMAVVAFDGDSMYETQFVIDKAEDLKDKAYQYLENTYWWEGFYKTTHWARDPVSMEIAYRDGKLAMVYSLTNSYGSKAGGWEQFGAGCFWLTVYDETGIVYSADYRMSQGMTEYEKENMCDIRDDVEIGISWGE